MEGIGRRYRGYRVAGGSVSAGLRPPGPTRWWQWRQRRRLRPGARAARPIGHFSWGSFAAAVSSLTAVAALLFTGLSLQQTRAQNQLDLSGQITDRFNAAVTNLGSDTETVRIGGILALQRIMQDSPRDQPAVIQVLTAFVRERTTSASPTRAPTAVPTSTGTGPAVAGTTAPPFVAIDVQTALTVVAERDGSHDQFAISHDANSIIDLSGANLAGAVLFNGNLENADLTKTDLDGAELAGADLSGAVFSGATFNNGQLEYANLSGAILSSVPLRGTDIHGANLYEANLEGANLEGANLEYANLNGANLNGTLLCRGTTPMLAARGYVCSA